MLHHASPEACEACDSNLCRAPSSTRSSWIHPSPHVRTENISPSISTAVAPAFRTSSPSPASRSRSRSIAFARYHKQLHHSSRHEDHPARYKRTLRSTVVGATAVAAAAGAAAAAAAAPSEIVVMGHVHSRSRSHGRSRCRSRRRERSRPRSPRCSQSSSNS